MKTNIWNGGWELRKIQAGHKCLTDYVNDTNILSDLSTDHVTLHLRVN